MKKTRRRLRGLSLHTQAAYLMRVTLFARFCNKHRDHLGEKEIREYLLHLVNEKHASYGVVTQTYYALRFLYRITMKRPWEVEKIPCMKKPERLPVILDKEEVHIKCTTVMAHLPEEVENRGSARFANRQLEGCSSVSGSCHDRAMPLST